MFLKIVFLEIFSLIWKHATFIKIDTQRLTKRRSDNEVLQIETFKFAISATCKSTNAKLE
jgi:hypothetical protein